VAIPIAEVEADYYEAFELDSTADTLSSILLALVIGSAITVLLATGVGIWTSRRLVQPLGRITDAAGEIASGDLSTRVALEGDPDLDRLVNSFNDMADAVQARIEREARFASDVSHELRSPITALAAAAEVIHGRRGELPDRTQQALDVVVGQVRRFDAMVIDLLELSRIDAGATELHTEEVDIVALCRRIIDRNGFRDLPLDVPDHAGNGSPLSATVDKLRFERILANLLENANHHGGGPTRVSIERTDGPFLLVVVEDAGPGVARGERLRIFERFARGSAARHRIGTGLGLALVSEHATAQGGDAWVEDRPSGGARFVVRIPSEAMR
jgi:signal transduction histidine kinase